MSFEDMVLDHLQCNKAEDESQLIALLKNNNCDDPAKVLRQLRSDRRIISNESNTTQQHTGSAPIPLYVIFHQHVFDFIEQHGNQNLTVAELWRTFQDYVARVGNDSEYIVPKIEFDVHADYWRKNR